MAEESAAVAAVAAVPGRQVAAAVEPALTDTVAAWPAPAAACMNSPHRTPADSRQLVTLPPRAAAVGSDAEQTETPRLDISASNI